jgi:membrane dipeptidase
VWNNPNALAYPNVSPQNTTSREGKGLTNLGKQMVEALQQSKIIIDVSHLSDGGVKDILAISRAPIVASHSNCNKVCKHSRNLTDSQIKAIANCGGVVGVNFCPKFISNNFVETNGGKVADGDGINNYNVRSVAESGGCINNIMESGGNSCDFFERVKNHIKNLINVGGEDVVAIGSDFDGMTPSPQLSTCESMQPMFNYLLTTLPYRIVEKLTQSNFARVFKDVVG